MNTQSTLVGVPLAQTMLRLAIPGVIGAILFSSLGMVEAAFLKSSGADALAAVAVVFPLIMLAAMLSAGAIGGSVSGHMARAMGAGDKGEAEAVQACAIVIAVVGGLMMWGLVALLGPVLFRWATDSVVIQEMAARYASIVFPAMPLFWLINMLTSSMRGTGDLVRPALVAAALLIGYIVFAALLITPNSAELQKAISSAGIASVLSYVTALALTLYYTLRPGAAIKVNLKALNGKTLASILKQGLLAGSQSVMTITYALVTTTLFSRFGTEWLAGFGLAVRLELIMVPIIFGIGASLIPIVGAYVGANQRQRAISIAWRGVLINAVVVGIIGLLFALAPGLWCNVVGSDATVTGHCKQAVRTISPTYFFFALGLGCYFASQALNTLMLPVAGALIRLLVVASGLLWVGSTTSPQLALYLVATAVVLYGVVVVAGLASGPWRLNYNNAR